MDMLETHASALESSNVAYHEFLLCYRTREQIVYGFVEGKGDPSFYRGLIESNLPEGWDVKLIISGNKNKVLRAFDEMDWLRFPKKRICFFVDRDLSDFIEGESRSSENLYITDNYSIENEAANFGTMKRILEEVLGVIDLSPAEMDSIKDLFECNLKLFGEAMSPVMAQILLWRRAGANISLNNINPKDLFIFEDGHIRLMPEFCSMDSRVRYAAVKVDAQRAANEDLAVAEAEFRKKEGLKKYIRGKYVLWFVIHCAKAIHKAIPNLCRKYQVAPKIRIELGIGNAFVVVALFVRCPASLKSFIKSNYGAYIECAFSTA